MALKRKTNSTGFQKPSRRVRVNGFKLKKKKRFVFTVFNRLREKTGKKRRNRLTSRTGTAVAPAKLLLQQQCDLLVLD